jgi:hypothetical protein
LSEPKIAFFDVENAPSLGWFYDPYKENNIVATEQPWFMLSFAWKRPKIEKITCRALPDYPGYSRDKTNDKKLICDLWELFDSHDILIGHNIGRFDCRKANSRFLAHGMKPPSPYIIHDSLKEVRKISFEDSNRLGSLSVKWGFGDKLPTQGWDTWHGCINGNTAAWRVMKQYNKIDTLRAEQVWGVIAPWKKTYGPGATSKICPSPLCGSLDVILRGPVRGGPKHNITCKTCGHWWTAKP